MFSSIIPKLGDHLFVGVSVFTNSYLFLPVANPKLFCFDLIFRTIIGLQKVKQARMDKNAEINKQSVVIFWLNWRQYGSVLNSLSCKLINTKMAIWQLAKFGVWSILSFDNWSFENCSASTDPISFSCERQSERI